MALTYGNTVYGVKPRVTWFFLALSFLVFVLINIIWLFPTLRDLRENNSKLRLQVAGRTADGVNNFMEGKINNLRNAASAVRFEKSEAGRLLERISKENPEFNTVSILNGELKEVLKVSRYQVVGSEDLLDYSGLKKLWHVWDDGFNYYRGPVLRNQNLEPFVSVAVPVIFGEKEKAVLWAELNLKFLSSLVSRFRFGQTGRVYLIDDAGNLIIHSDISLVLRGLSLKGVPAVRDVIGGETVLGLRYSNEKGVEVEASGIFLEDFNWGIIVEQDLSEINIQRDRIVLVAVLSIGMGILFLLLLFYNNLRLVNLNQKLKEILQELDEVGRVLVRRDLELTEANVRLQELDLVKSEFVSVAAHQLRTPLTGIRWSYHVLLEEDEGRLSSEQRKIIMDGFEASVRAINLINDLLNVARIEEGRFGFEVRRASLMPIVEKVFFLMQTRAAEKGIKFKLDPPPAELPELNLDEEKVSIALDDLLDNALKYTSPGGEVILKILAEKGWVKVSVQDTGIGIPQDQLHRVFSKFFRADNALLFQTTGTGLGLYVAKNIIEKLGGRISFISEEGKGSTFVFMLPIPSS